MDFGDASLAAVITGLFGIGTGILFLWLKRRSSATQRRTELEVSLEAALKTANEIVERERAEDKARIRSLEAQVRERDRQLDEKQEQIVRLVQGRQRHDG